MSTQLDPLVGVTQLLCKTNDWVFLSLGKYATGFKMILYAWPLTHYLMYSNIPHICHQFEEGDFLVPQKPDP